MEYVVNIWSTCICYYGVIVMKRSQKITFIVHTFYFSMTPVSFLKALLKIIRRKIDPQLTDAENLFGYTGIKMPNIKIDAEFKKEAY